MQEIIQLLEEQEKLEEIVHKQSTELQEKQDEIHIATRRLEKLEKVEFSQSSSEATVGFSAYVSGSNDEEFEAGTVLPFSNIITNIGDSFNPENSSFVCPVDGLYMFTVNMQVTSSFEGQILANINSSRVGSFSVSFRDKLPV